MGDENVDVVPGSRRPDGTYRKPVRVKKGYVPPEEQQTYDKFKMEKPTGVIGADVAEKGPPKTGAAKKNEKRKKKGGDGAGAAEAPAAAPAAALAVEATEVAAAVSAAAAAPASEEAAAKEPSELEKKIKALKKRLRQIDDLAAKAASGATLNADQAAKVAARGEVEAEIAKWESLEDMDVGKKVKALRKKIRQIEDLEEKAKGGVELNAEQKGKIDSKKEVIAECELLEALSLS